MQSGPRYPALDFIVRYGNWIAIAFGLAFPLTGAALWQSGWSIVFLLGSVAIGGFGYLLMQSYVEMVRVIVDMLMPK